LVATLDRIFREEWGRVLAALIGFLGDFDLAEESAQEAFAIAAGRWPRDGIPSHPRAWLMGTARNRATDRIRRDRALATKFGPLVPGDRTEVPMNTTTFPDERLELIFMCCHPALATEAQVALTLRRNTTARSAAMGSGQSKRLFSPTGSCSQGTRSLP
jgi:RNA polymerase sigma-70 factor (ECF subfamily)